jgi:flagellar hook protein FlgE
MSIYNALNVGISGLQAQSTKIDVISTNLANTTTVGYKAGIASFADLIANDTVSGYAPGGVRALNVQSNDTQGTVAPTGSNTDIAISGTGYFAVSQNPDASGSVLYSRAGSFTPDKDGNLRNGAGFYLQAWPTSGDGTLAGGLSGASVDAASGIAALQPVNVHKLNEEPSATTQISIKANLNAAETAYAGVPPYNAADPAANMASGSVPTQFNTPVQVVDSTGADHQLTVGYLKTGTNSWAVEAYVVPASDVAGAANGQVAAGTVTFNGDGSLASISPSLSQPLSFSWTNGAPASSVSLGLGTAGAVFGTPGATSIGRTDGLSQTSSAYVNTNVQQNGIDVGTLTGITITSDGYVRASYSNATTRDLYKIPLAEFTSPNQLNSISGNVFSQTTGAGTVNFLQPGQSGAGQLQSSALESSNENEQEDLTNLVVAQQAYQFNTKVITTSDTMLQTLTTMGTT